MQSNEKRGAWCLVAVLAAALVTSAGSAPAFGAGEPAKKAAPKPAAKGKNVMTRDELRACMNEQDRLEKLSTKIKGEQAALDRQLADVRKLDEDIARKRAALDPEDAAALEALNLEETKRDGMAESYNARLPAFREEGDLFDSSRRAWAERCADRNFDEMDEAAIKREQRRAAGAAKK